MLSDDHYRAKLQQTTAAIKAWTGFVADVADVEEGEHGEAWRLALVPHAAHACPVEILLREDRRFDLALAGEIYEDCELGSLDDLLPLIEAVVEGRVIRRVTRSAATGLLREVSTIVAMADGTVIELGRNGVVTDAEHDASGEVRDRHFLPYRRS